LSDALDNAPEWWDKDKEAVNYAIFLISPVTVKEIFEVVGEAKPEYEKVGYYKDVIFWTAQRKTISKTRWYKIPSSSVNNNVTIRNANTAKKLLFLSNR
jgi:uncharacterized protein (DUF1697 family)